MDSILLEDIKQKLNSISFDILQMLSKNETLTYSQIKDKLKVSQHKITREIARLEGALLIEGKKSEFDGREIIFNLTINGQKILKL